MLYVVMGTQLKEKTQLLLRPPPTHRSSSIDRHRHSQTHRNKLKLFATVLAKREGVSPFNLSLVPAHYNQTVGHTHTHTHTHTHAHTHAHTHTQTKKETSRTPPTKPRERQHE